MENLNANEISMLRAIIGGMKEDGVIDEYLQAGKERQIKIMENYAVESVHKMQQFAHTYFTNKTARQSFVVQLYRGLQS
jgi:hypothetical protein